MDAKVLRAAVSAAIRVTVSTTLIGCGGNVSTDTGRAAVPPDEPAVKGTPVKTSEPAAKNADPHVSSPRPTPATGGSAPAIETPTAGVANDGGSSLGGFASTAGAGGDEAGAGAPSDVCGAAALACVTSLEQAAFDAPLSAADQACCDTVLKRFRGRRPSAPNASTA